MIVTRRAVTSGGDTQNHPTAQSDEAQAYFNELSVQPSEDHKDTLDNFLIKPLVANGIWAQLDRLWVFATDSETSAATSLVNPTSTDITLVNSPTFTAFEGYAGNGTTSYIETNFNPSTDGSNYTQNSASMGSYTRTDLAQNSIDIGVTDLTHVAYVAPYWLSGLDTLLKINDDTVGTGSQTSSDGLTASVRTASNDRGAWRDGVEILPGSAASTGVPNQEVYICAFGNNGTATSLSTRQISVVFIGSGAVNQLNMYNVIQSYMTALGKQV